MKKLTVLALALLFAFGAALAENPYLIDWVTAYNARAEINGLPSIDAAQFEEVSEENYWGLEFDEDTVFMLAFNPDGSLYMCALQAESGDERLINMMGCALAVSDEAIDYDKGCEIMKGVLDKLSEGNPMSFDIVSGWYIVAAYENVDGTGFATIGFTKDAGENTSGDDPTDGEPDGIWDGLEPGGDAPAPKSTPKPKEGHYKI